METEAAKKIGEHWPQDIHEFFDKNHDDAIETKEVSAAINGQGMERLVRLIDGHAGDAFAMGTFIDEIKTIDPPKGRMLEYAYLKFGNSEQLQRTIYRHYSTGPFFSESVWQKVPDRNGQTVGTPWKPNLLIHGVALRTVPHETIVALVQKYQTQIENNPLLINAIYETAQDEETYKALEHFFQHGGSLDTWPSSGKYDPLPLAIHVGIDKPASTLYHELLHYLFDVNDSYVTETPSNGGLDHEVIAPLENRWKKIRAIRRGEPLPDNLFRDFSIDWKRPDLRYEVESGDFANRLFAENNLFSLSALDSQQNNLYKRTKIGETLLTLYEDPFCFYYPFPGAALFYPVDKSDVGIQIQHYDLNLVSAQMLMDAGLTEEEKAKVTEEIKAIHHEPQIQPNTLTMDQVKDVEYLQAINIALTQELARLALQIAESQSLQRPQDAMATELYKKRADQFFLAFFGAIETHPERNPIFAAREATNIIMSLSGNKP